MAGFLRPDDRWLIDWLDTGLYDHPHSDVTPYYHSYIIRYGSDTESNPAEVQLTKAQGVLRLEDSENRFDPGSTHTDLSRRALRQPHRCKLESQFTRALFDMNVSPPTRLTDGYSYRSDSDPDEGSATRPKGLFPWQNINWELVSIRYDNFQLVLHISPEQPGSGDDILTRLNASDPDWYITIEFPSLPTVPVRTILGSTFTLTPGVARQDRIQSHFAFSPFRARAGIDFRLRLVANMKQIMWEGVAVPTTGRRLVAEDFADFDLESRWNDLYRDPITVPTTVGGTLNAFLDIGMPTQWRDSTLDERMNPMEIGRADYEGTNQGFVNVAARYAGGWAYETRYGKIGIASWQVANASVDTADHIDRRWRPRRDGHLFEHRPKYVKNYAEPKALGVVTDHVTKLLTRQFTNTQFRRVQAPFPPAAIPIRYGPGAPHHDNPEVVGIVWPPATPPPDTSATFDKLPDPGPDRGVWTFNLQRGTEGLNNAAKTGQWILTVRAASVETEISQRDYTFEVIIWGRPQYINVVRGVGEQDGTSVDGTPKVNTPSITDYGELRLDVPTWYPDRAQEFAICAEWVNRLGNPLRYVRLVLGRYHKDETMLGRIADLDTGQIILLTLRDVDGVDLLVKMIILAVQYEKGLDQSPTKTIYGFTVEEGDVQIYRWTTDADAQGRFNWRDDPDTTDPQVGFWRD